MKNYVQDPPAEIVVPKAKAEEPKSLGPKFGLNVPKGWDFITDQTKIPQPPEELGVKLVMIAQSDENIGSEPVQLLVMMTSLEEDEQGAAFGEGIVLGLAAQGVPILTQTKINLGKHVATYVIFINDPYAVAQLNVAVGNVGIMVGCRGDNEEAEAVLQTCREVIRTFRIDD